MKTLFLLLLAVAAYCEELEGLLNVIPKDLLSGLENESKMVQSNSGMDAFKIPGEADKFSSKGIPLPGKSLKAIPLKK